MSAYFNQAATSYPKPETVYHTMDNHIRNNAGSFARSTSKKHQSLWTETRVLLTELMDCPSKKVVFTSTATEALNVIFAGNPPKRWLFCLYFTL